MGVAEVVVAVVIAIVVGVVEVERGGEEGAATTANGVVEPERQFYSIWDSKFQPINNMKIHHSSIKVPHCVLYRPTVTKIITVIKYNCVMLSSLFNQ